MSRSRGRLPGLIPDGPAIRRIREDQAMTPAELAARIGSHRESIYAAEGRRRPISRLQAVKIAKALGVELKDITRDDGSEEKREPAA